MPADLPLFPLGTTLVPGADLPLHVFEPRYLTMVADLLKAPEDLPRRFGVVAIRHGHEVGTARPELYDVGCTAVVRSVAEAGEGRLDLLATGGLRFRLVSVATDHPYLTGHVEFLAEHSGAGAERRAARAASAYDGYADALGRLGVGAREPRSLPGDPIALSYALAGATVLDLAEAQAVLAAPDAATRLALLGRLLRRETAIIGRLRAMPGAALLRSSPMSAN